MIVAIAFALSITFVVVGIAVVELLGVGDGAMPCLFVVMPGIAGLSLAVVALMALWIPVTSGWAWLPAALSCGATLSGVVSAGVMALLFKLFD